MNSIRALFLVLSAAVISSCSILPESKVPALSNYRLPAVTIAKPAPVRARGQLVIGEPLAGVSLDNRRIQVLDAHGELLALPGVIWADRPAAMLQSELLSALQGGGAFAAVLPAGSDVASDLRVVSRLLDFQIDTFSDPAAHVQVDWSLVDGAGQVQCHTRVNARIPVVGSETAAMVSALRKAAAAGLLETVQWLTTDPACGAGPP